MFRCIKQTLCMFCFAYALGDSNAIIVPLSNGSSHYSIKICLMVAHLVPFECHMFRFLSILSDLGKIQQISGFQHQPQKTERSESYQHHTKTIQNYSQWICKPTVLFPCLGLLSLDLLNTPEQMKKHPKDDGYIVGK